MISFVCWKWRTAGSPRAFRSEHVNIVRAMIARWYPRDFRFICLTDDPAGLAEPIEALPLPVRFDQLRSPQGERFPNCYCRLWNFSREAAAVLGKRIFQIDIDVVVTGDLRPLVDRQEDFVGWADRRFQKNKIAGGAYLLKTGSMPHVWEDFDPASSPAAAFAVGYLGSDQGWMSYKMTVDHRPQTADEEKMTAGDGLRSTVCGHSIGTWNGAGLVKLNWTPRYMKTAPTGAILVFTSGLKPPWHRQQQTRYPWIKKYWRL